MPGGAIGRPCRSSDSISAIYNGDTDFLTSTSASVNQTVATASTSLAVSSSNLNAVYGDKPVYTATINVTGPGAGSPSGTVTFYSNGTALGTAALNGSGQAAFDTATLSGFPYRSMMIDITLRGSGNRVRRTTIDGRPTRAASLPAHLTGHHRVEIEFG